MNLEIDNLCKSFGKQSALEHATVSIPEYKVLVLIGHSGGGKSTLLKLIGGLEYPDQGSIILDGSPIVFKEKELLAHRRNLGMVFQSWNLFPHLTAIENITLPLYRVHGMKLKEAEALGYELLKRFSMQKHAFKKPYELSGGQCQRVAIIRAMAPRPKLLLLDEPTSALDPLMAAEVFDLIVELKNEGCNLIIVTHQLSFAEKIADWALFLSEGKILASDATDKMFKSQNSPVIQNYLDKVRYY